MRFFGLQLLVILMCAGCSSSSHDVAGKEPDIISPVTDDPPPARAADTAAEAVTRIPPLKSWAPKYIQTGLASGIMVEFTGVKKDKPLHARFAGIELRRYPTDAGERSANQLTLNQPGNDFVPPAFDIERAEPIVLNTTINDVKQAFFKVPPGKYVMRQTKEWADQSYIGGVIVREGNYSVIMIPVRIPGAGQP